MQTELELFQEHISGRMTSFTVNVSCCEGKGGAEKGSYISPNNGATVLCRETYKTRALQSGEQGDRGGRIYSDLQNLGYSM